MSEGGPPGAATGNDAAPAPESVAPADVMPKPRAHVVLFGVLPFALALLVGSRYVEGELGHFLAGSWGMVPLMVLCSLAYLGVARKWARALSQLWWLALIASAITFDVIAGFLARWRYAPNGKIVEGTGSVGGEISAILVLALLAALSPMATHWLAWRRFPGREGAVARMAVATVVALTGLAVVPLVVLGEPPLLAWIAASVRDGVDPFGGRDQAGLLRDQLYGLCWTLPAVLFAVGWGVRRDFHGALARLGVVRPTRLQLLWALALTCILYGASVFVDELIRALWLHLGWPVTDLDAVEALFAFALSPVGAIVIALTAGIGEEVAVRGVLQPRLGILLSNLFFTALHAYQYNWDALLSVFLWGLVLGVIRRRSNTTVCAVVHGGYDSVVSMVEVAAGGY